LTRIQEEMETLVRLLGGPEAGILAHGPESATVHRGLDSPGEGKTSREADLRVLIDGDIFSGV
jgi:hypothetical protein